MCFSSEFVDTRTKCRFMFEQPCQCPPNQLEAIKFNKVISAEDNSMCCACAEEYGHRSLEVLYKCSTCGKETHRIYECFIDVDYYSSRRYDWSDRDYDTRIRSRYRTRTYSSWGQYTANVAKMALLGRMTMKNFEAVERKFDVMSIVQDNYFKTTDDWTDTLIRRLE
ncbi:hypothetical protein niasHS_006150 [Heterodera schachtii]|uniref:Uncharacterized protein n=1 Tax=Heterodera schachtii TaxID=97005 RepID=A0ABD2JWE4_HETSC